MALSRVPFLTAPVSSDEGGFLVVGSQWSPGPSLYGHYWVDRPPLLIAIFALADGFGGPVALRTIGLVAAVLAVVAAAVLGWVASGQRGVGVLGATVTATALLATPLFGSRIVDGELLACPFVLAGVAALLASHGPMPPSRARALRTLAGVLGVAAVMIKQNMLDVLVVAAALAVHALCRHGARSAWRSLSPFVAGALSTAALIVALAWVRGTSPPALWHAVVTFRFDAAHLLGFSITRMSGIVQAYVMSGALALTLVAGLVCLAHRPRRQDEAARSVPWRLLAFVLVGWELVGVIGGGSYWSHYLVGLIPGLTLLVAVALRGSCTLHRRAIAVTLVCVSLSTAYRWSHDLSQSGTASDDQIAAGYIRSHANPGDSIVVAFGHANIVKESGLDSPYPYLWALPAFVNDPQLTRLDLLLLSPRAPQWFVAGGNLSQWGPPGTALQRIVARRYATVLRTTRWTVLRRDGEPGQVPAVR